MSSRDGNGRFGPGAMRAADTAKGGAGGLPTPPPRPGTVRAVADAAHSAAANFAAAGPPPAAAAAAAAPAAPLSDEAARARVARAGLRQFNRAHPAGSGPVHTPTGDAVARKVFERNTQGQGVDYISTEQAAYPGSSEPKRYEDIARTLTPTAAAAGLGSAPLSADESVAARRAATTASALADVSEQQRNGGRKHARAAMRSVASGALSAQEVYAGQTPAFPQAKGSGGMQYHRDVMAKGALTAGFKTVVENFSDSSDDEQVAALSPRDAIQRYRMRTETAAVRNTFGAGVGAAASAAAGNPAATEAAPAPRRSSAKRAQAGAEDRADAFAASSARAAGAAAAPEAASSSAQARSGRAEARARQRAEAFAARLAAPAAAAGADADMEPVDLPRDPLPAGSSARDAKRQRRHSPAVRS